MANPLLKRYDLYYKEPGATEMGFMLAKDSNGRKLWGRSDERGLPDSYAPGDVGYANLSPDIQKVIAHSFMHGGLGALQFESEEDAAFTKLRSLKTEDVDTRCKGKFYPGPKVTTLALPKLETPTGHVDPAAKWTTEANAYDEDVTTKATCGGIGIGAWGGWLELTVTAGVVIGLGFFAGGDAEITKVDIDYYEGGWVDLFEGDFVQDQWNFKSIAGSHTITAARIRFWNSSGAAAKNAELFEFDFVKLGGDAPVAFETFNGKEYVATGKILGELNTTDMRFDAVGEFDNAITDIEAFGSNLIIALGAANKYWYMSTAYAFTETAVAEGEADKLQKVGGTIRQLKLPNRIRSTTDPTVGVWGAEITVGTTDYNVNDMEEYLDLLYCTKQDGIYYIDAAGAEVHPFASLETIAHVDAGKQSDVFRGRLYFRMGNQQEWEVDGTTLTEVTPSNFAPGVDEYAYPCVARAHDEAWLYTIMYRADNNLALLAGRWEYLAGKTRWIWHDIRKLTGITNAQCAHVSSVEGRPYLYIGSNTNAELVQRVYLPVTNDATADADYRFVTSGKLWTPRYTSPLIAFDKRWKEAYFRSENGSATKYVNVQYSTDDGATFALLGKMDTSPEETLTFTSIQETMLNLRLDFVSDSESTVPVIEYFNLKAMTIVPSVVRFNHAVKCASNLGLKNDHQSDVKQSAIIAFVDKLRDKICTLGDPWGNEHTVKVNVKDDVLDFDEDKDPPDLIYYIEATKV